MWKELFEEIKHELTDDPDEQIYSWAADLEPVIHDFTASFGNRKPSEKISHDHISSKSGGIIWFWGQIQEIDGKNKAHIGTELRLSAVRKIKGLIFNGVRIVVVTNGTLLGHGILNPYNPNDFISRVYDKSLHVHSTKQQRLEVAKDLKLALPMAIDRAKSKAQMFPDRIEEIIQRRIARGAFAPDQDLSRILK